MISVHHSGSFKNTEKFLTESYRLNYLVIMEKYGKQGVLALRAATPIDSGETAILWNYKIKKNYKSISITWTNSHIIDGVPIAIIIQYGHVTGTGGYVQGIDYINPTMKPIFDKIVNDIDKEVRKL